MEEGGAEQSHPASAGTASDVKPRLREALLQWCDAALVQEVIAAEQHFSDDQLRRLYGCVLAPDRPRGSSSRYSSPEREARRLQSAWDALTSDFKRRVMYGLIVLVGTRTGSAPGGAEVLPAVWAADFAFDFNMDKVRCFHRTWLAVAAQNGTGAVERQRGLAALNGTVAVIEPTIAAGAGDAKVFQTSQEQEIGTPASKTAIPVPRLKRGKPSVAPIIRAAVERHWAYVCDLADGKDGSPPVWSHIASGLHKRMVADAARGIGERVAYETVRKHLKDVYTRAMGEIARSVKSAQ